MTTDNQDALMFGEEPDDRDADPRLDRGGSIEDTLAGQDDLNAALDPGEPQVQEPPAAPPPLGQSEASAKEPSSGKVISISNTPRTHARDDQDNNNQQRQDDDQNQDTGLDWEAIGLDYAAGVLSVRAIARAHGCQGTTISRHAARHGWTRNLTQQVQQRAQAELLLGRTTETEGQNGNNDDNDHHASEQAIEKAATVQVQVVQAHRKDLAKLRALQARLTEQAEAYFEITGKDKDGSGLITNLATLQTAVQVVESLARTVGRVIPLERAAFNIDAKQGPASEAQAIERRVQAAADRKAASPDDPSAVPRAVQMLREQADTREINDKRRADRLAAKANGA